MNKPMMVVSMCVLAVCGLLLIEAVSDKLGEASAMVQAENECIAEFIELGIERKNIITENGECYVR